MRFVALALLAPAACWSRSPAPPIAKVDVPHAPFEVQPSELGDEGVLARIRHRAIVHRWDHARLRLDAEQTDMMVGENAEADTIVGVIGEASQHIRIVVGSKAERRAV